MKEQQAATFPNESRCCSILISVYVWEFFFGFCLVKVLLVYDENHFGATGEAVNRGYKGTNEFK